MPSRTSVNVGFAHEDSSVKGMLLGLGTSPMYRALCRCRWLLWTRAQRRAWLDLNLAFFEPRDTDNL